MEINLTQNKLIKFLYQETTTEEYLGTLELIENNPSVKKSYKELNKSKMLLDNIQITPSSKSIRLILRESQMNTEELV